MPRPMPHYPVRYPTCQVPGFPGGSWPPPTGDRLTLTALTAAAGWPDAEWTTEAAPTQTSARFDHELGVLTHGVIGALAHTAQTSDAESIRSLIAGKVDEVLANGRRGRHDRVRARLGGLVGQYFRLFLPPHPANLIGREAVTVGGRGRMDLVWHDHAIGVFIDEIKTWRHPHPNLDGDTWEQVHRYIEWGVDTHSDTFAGVRIISLGHTDQCKVVTPSGALHDLRDSGISRPALIRAHNAASAA